MRLRIVEVLEYYDVPQLFVAKDAVGTSYLCLTYDVDELGIQYCIAVDISCERLNDFFTGHLDLRHIYIQPELSIYDVCIREETIDATKRVVAFDDRMLPEEGYYLDFSQRENREMVNASNEANRTIIRIVFNYETNNHTVPSRVLSYTLHSFQSIINKVYHRLYRNQLDTDANLLVRAVLPASFDLELMSEEELNLFGWTRVSDTLEMIKPLFSEDDDEVTGCIDNFKDTLTSYKSLVKTLADENVSFKFKWVGNSKEARVQECPVSNARVRSLYSLASSLEEMEDRSETFEGRFFMANTKNGSWGVLPLEGRQKKGVCADRTMLNGITLNDQLYRVTCMIHSSRNPNTGKEYHSYVITNIDKILDLLP